MRTQLVPVACAALALLAAPAATLAATPLGEHFTFSGFGTLGAVTTDNSEAEFLTPGQTHGVKRDVALGVDSKLGLQLNGKFGDVFSATAQVLVRDNYEGNWKPGVEWLFAKAQLNPTVGIRVGRIGAPMFAVSDYRNVNYANTFLRAPLEVYGQVVTNNFDGADVLLQHAFGPVNVSAQVFGGDSKAYYSRTRVDVKKLHGVNITAEFDGGYSLRLGHAQGKLTVHSSQLRQLVAVLGTTPFASLGQALDATGKDASFSGVGFTMDRSDVIVNAEYTWRRSQTYLPDTTGWYVLGGMRFGAFTPYAIVSQQKVDATVANTVPAGLSPQLNVLKATVDGLINGQYTAQKTTSVGLRWDALNNAAVKLQWDRTRPEGAGGYFSKPTPAFAGKTVQVLSASLDFVF